MRTIWKYQISRQFDLDLPMGWRVVSIAMQLDIPYLWILQTTLATSTHHFRVFATGEAIPDTATWIGTWHAENDELVWHLFQVEPEASPKP